MQVRNHILCYIFCQICLDLAHDCGRSPDLLLSFSVEIINGAGKLADCCLKFIFDLLIKFSDKRILLNHFPHFPQFTVHGLGCAITGGGRCGDILSCLVKLTVKLIYSRLDLVQNIAKFADA
ncbi:maltooligosaccharide ABC transportor ATP-binding protein, putative [Babesia ovata]|uniref:Maltooligosaccharide ABC transportor ATP-binding protein, putative n=1 Tax=Babesia ovata TaxID=189622 RepID=A0A2H6KD30_9APIC|nr:maltooligosaccharide ABC transportor ATP-binding protein, putative [Babesia ovata]GBE60903.1 maltooligosaccharide ABC transportor ATP-binding protein, putative [Babesia ovata]